jgi:hypothetical protein
MKLKSVGLILLLAALMVVLVGCAGISRPTQTGATLQAMVEQALTAVPTPVTPATPIPVSHTDRFNLTQGLFL